jgi:hypothetical protein
MSVDGCTDACAAMLAAVLNAISSDFPRTLPDQPRRQTVAIGDEHRLERIEVAGWCRRDVHVVLVDLIFA